METILERDRRIHAALAYTADSNGLQFSARNNCRGKGRNIMTRADRLEQRGKILRDLAGLRGGLRFGRCLHAKRAGKYEAYEYAHCRIGRLLWALIATRCAMRPAISRNAAAIGEAGYSIVTGKPPSPPTRTSGFSGT